MQKSMPQDLRLIIVTGISGAGKTQALKYMEDFGYFCVDNLPPMLIPTLLELCDGNNLRKWKNRVALGIDVRGGDFFDSIYEALLSLNGKVRYEILFVDAEDDVLVKRYKETRRNHPLSETGSLLEEIHAERDLMQPLKDTAHYRVDTTNSTTRQLRERLMELFAEEYRNEKFHITVCSFGFKWGMPSDADLVFDARFVTNPFYVDRLKRHSRKDSDVIEYVMSFPQTQTFLTKIKDLLTFLIPEYIQEGKGSLVIAIGCTGGMHRSVAIADAIAAYLATLDYNVVADHRDLDKENRRYFQKEQ